MQPIILALATIFPILMTCGMGGIGIAQERPNQQNENPAKSLPSQALGDASNKKIFSPKVVPLENFLNRTSIHGFSFHESQKYSNDVGKIREFSQTKKCGGIKEDVRFCSNIVNVLGAIRGEESLQGITDILSGRRLVDVGVPPSPPSPKDINMRTRADALMSLGSWININEGSTELKDRIGSLLRGLVSVVEKSIQVKAAIMKRSSIKDTFAKISVEKDTPFEIPKEFFEEEATAGRLARSALLGLGLSGSTDTIIGANGSGLPIQDFLETKLSNKPIGTSSRALVIKALETHNTIAKVGVTCFYDRKEGKRVSQDCREKWRALEVQDFRIPDQNGELKGQSKQSQDFQKHLEALLGDSVPGTSFRAIIIEGLKANNIISKVGATCYYEIKNGHRISEDCKTQWSRVLPEGSFQNKRKR